MTLEGVTRRELDDGEPPSYGILAALQDHLEKSIVEIQPPLHDAIDPEALNSIVESPGTEIEFTYQDCHIRVTDDAVVEVT